MTVGTAPPTRSLATRISSRTSALALTCALLVVLAIAGVVPQAGSPDRGWEVWARPDVHRVVAALALDRIMTTWPVAMLFALAALSMAVAAARQVPVAYARTFGPTPRGRRLVTRYPAALRTALRAEGFLRMASRDGVETYARRPWAYWGGVVLHVGLLLTLAAGLGMSLTEARGVASLAEGDSFGPASPFAAEQRGLLARAVTLPETFTVAAASAEYWPDGTQRQIETTLAFGADERVGLHVNAPAMRDGVRFYQGQRHGRTFLVKVVRPDGSLLRVRFDIEAPPTPDAASYFGGDVKDGDHQLRAKYFADEARRSMTGEPLLVLRLERDGAEVAQARLRPGTTGALGQYEVTLVDAVVWTDLYVVRHSGQSLLFLGFALVIAGSALLYLMPPAAVRLLPRDDGRYDVTWEASRFAPRLPAALSAHLITNGNAA